MLDRSFMVTILHRSNFRSAPHPIFCAGGPTSKINETAKGGTTVPFNNLTKRRFFMRCQMFPVPFVASLHHGSFYKTRP